MARNRDKRRVFVNTPLICLERMHNFKPCKLGLINLIESIISTVINLRNPMNSSEFLDQLKNCQLGKTCYVT